MECHTNVPAVMQGGRAGQNMTSFILSIHTHDLRGARHWSNPKEGRSRGSESLPQAQQDPVFHAAQTGLSWGMAEAEEA